MILFSVRKGKTKTRIFVELDDTSFSELLKLDEAWSGLKVIFEIKQCICIKVIETDLTSSIHLLKGYYYAESPLGNSVYIGDKISVFAVINKKIFSECFLRIDK